METCLKRALWPCQTVIFFFKFPSSLSLKISESVWLKQCVGERPDLSSAAQIQSSVNICLFGEMAKTLTRYLQGEGECYFQSCLDNSEQAKKSQIWLFGFSVFHMIELLVAIGRLFLIPLQSEVFGAGWWFACVLLKQGTSDLVRKALVSALENTNAVHMREAESLPML